jgi:glycosyltransferase involved in cell wall biosynthesis
MGGYGNLMADFCRLLNSRGHCLRVLSTLCPQLGDTEGTDPFVERSLKLYGTWSTSGQRPYSPEVARSINQYNLTTTSSAAREFQPDVCLIGNIDLIGPWPLQALAEAGFPILHYVANANPGYPAHFAPQGGCHRYAAISQWVLDNMQHLGYPVDGAEVIYSGAPVEEFYQPQLPSRDCLRLAYASLVMAYKGADLFVEALGLLASLGLDFSATIAGDTFDPDYVQQLRDRVSDLNLTQAVTFTGLLARSKLKQLYSTHNVLVFPSRFPEPFGISQLEAMAAGLTVITSATGGAKEIIRNGEDGLWFAPNNALDLANVLSSLPANPTRWEATARSGQARAIQNFSQTQAVHQLERSLEKLAKVRYNRPAQTST